MFLGGLWIHTLNYAVGRPVDTHTYVLWGDANLCSWEGWQDTKLLGRPMERQTYVLGRPVETPEEACEQEQKSNN